MSLTAVSEALSLVTGRERASTSLGHLLVSVGVLLWSSAWAQRELGASGHKGAAGCRPVRSAAASACRMPAWHGAAPLLSTPRSREVCGAHFVVSVDVVFNSSAWTPACPGFCLFLSHNSCFLGYFLPFNFKMGGTSLMRVDLFLK